MKTNPWLLFDSLPKDIASRLYGPLDAIELPDSGELNLDIGAYTSPLPHREWASPGWIGKRVFLATVVNLVPEVMDELVAQILTLMDQYRDWFFAPPAQGQEWTPELYLSEVKNAFERIRQGQHREDEPPTLGRDTDHVMSIWLAKWCLGDEQHPYFAYIATLDAFDRAITHVFGTTNGIEAEIAYRVGLARSMARPEVWDALVPDDFAEGAASMFIEVPRWIPTMES